MLLYATATWENLLNMCQHPKQHQLLNHQTPTTLCLWLRLAGWENILAVFQINLEEMVRTNLQIWCCLSFPRLPNKFQLGIMSTCSPDHFTVVPPQQRRGRPEKSREAPEIPSISAHTLGCWGPESSQLKNRDSLQLQGYKTIDNNRIRIISIMQSTESEWFMLLLIQSWDSLFLTQVLDNASC